MIVVTGGAGFIGSVLIWHLNALGRSDIIVVDHLGSSQKWRNLVGLHFLDYIDKTDFLEQLQRPDFARSIDTLYHLGACSSTTEQNADYLMSNNYRYSLQVGQWWAQHRSARFVYASSAATYGGGEQGYSDNPQGLEQLRPLNMYGYSKHLFDLYAQRQGWLEHCIGLKFFNVFGPNEYHKGPMQSLIAKSCLQVAQCATIELFESHRSDYAHGEQRRDFIYVKDAVALMVELAHNPAAAGLINVGTGQARSWNELARALFDALQIEGTIRYTPMPVELRDTYQYFTQADCQKLKGLHCTHRCRTLEEAVRDYVRGYLVEQRTITEPLSIKD